MTRVRGRQLDADRAGEFGEFFRASYPATLRRAYRVAGGLADVAQDAVQETYIRAMERWETLRSLTGNQQRAWLGQAVTNVLMDAWRSCSRAPSLSLLTDVEAHPRIAVPPPDADQVLLAQWYRQVCLAAATHLHGRRLEAFALHFLAGYEIHEVAEMLGITSTTVRVHLSTARRKLVAEAPAMAEIREALRREEVS